MDFSFTDEQQMLRDSLERFIEKDYAFDTRMKLAESERGFGDDNWKTFAELGVLGMPFPEEQGGFGGGTVEAGLAAEIFGSGLVVEPFLPTVILGGGAASFAGRADIVEQVAGGGLHMALAYFEQGARYNLNHCTTKAEKKGGDFVLSGAKGVVMNLEAADKVVVSARTSGGDKDEAGITLFLVDKGAKGVSTRCYKTQDMLRAGELTLEGVTVSKDDVLGEVDDGLALLTRVIDRATAVLCCEAAGIMASMVSQTQDYLNQRQQFGVPLSKFQVLQHRMADMFMEKEQAFSMAYMAAAKQDWDDAVERPRAASAAKEYVGRGGRLVGQEAIQMHGGMGVTWEMPVAHYFKRLTMIDTIFGNMDFHRRRYAGLMESKAA